MHIFYTTMPPKSAPSLQKLEPTLEWMEVYIRKPLEGTWIDVNFFTPVKKMYLETRKRE